MSDELKFAQRELGTKPVVMKNQNSLKVSNLQVIEERSKNSWVLVLDTYKKQDTYHQRYFILREPIFISI